MKITKLILIILAGLFVFLSLKAFIFNDNEQESFNANGSGARSEKVQSFSLEGFSETGEKTWQIEGKSADIYTETIDLTDITAHSYGEGIKVSLKSDKGAFSRKNNNIELRENVVLTTDDGARLTTQVLNWDAKKEIIFTEEDVYIEREDIKAKGVGAQASPSLKKAYLKKAVRVDINDPKALITCDGPLEIDYNNNVAYFNRNVKLDDNKATIATEKATAYFNPDERSLTEVLCEGDVKITRGKDTTNADRLLYIPKEGRVVLEGRPQIVIDSAKELLDKEK